MNKEEIIEILNKYNFDKKEFYVISGAALVLMGVINKTKDIDICVSNNYFNILLNTFHCVYERTNEFKKDVYMIDDVINFGVSFKPDNYEIVSGFKVASLKDCFILKKFLNRDKDKEILKILKKLL